MALALAPVAPSEPNVMQMLARLPGERDDTSYRLPQGLAVEQWAAIGEVLQAVEKSIGWWLGDWWNYGQRHYGEMKYQAARDHIADLTGHTYKTVVNAAAVAKAFEPSRRRENLSFSHHEAVSSLKDAEQQEELLDQAAGDGLSVMALRDRAEPLKREQKRRKHAAKPTPTLADDDPIQLWIGDATELVQVADGSVDLVITSPPYALGIEYAGGDVDQGEWYDFTVAWLAEAFRVLKIGGRIALNVPLDTTLGGRRPTGAQATTALVQVGFSYRNTVLWLDNQLGKSVARGSQDSAASPNIYAPAEVIILASKGAWGREEPYDRPSDLAHADWLDWCNGTWTFPGESSPWEDHPAPFREELPRRLLYLLSFPGDQVLDPFVGSGTTALASAKAGRRCIGIDRDPLCVASAARRLAAWRG